MGAVNALKTFKQVVTVEGVIHDESHHTSLAIGD